MPGIPTVTQAWQEIHSLFKQQTLLSQSHRWYIYNLAISKVEAFFAKVLICSFTGSFLNLRMKVNKMKSFLHPEINSVVMLTL